MKRYSQTQVDYLKFKRMITPPLLKLLFWIGVFACICESVRLIVEWPSSSGIPAGGRAILILVLGPIAIRLACELLLITFSIHDTLVEIRDNLDNRPS